MSALAIDSLDSIPRDAEIFIFGAGGAGANLLELIRQNRPDILVSSFVDTYRTGGNLNGIEIVNVSSLSDEDKAALIIVASIYQKEICETLASRGFTNFCIFSNDPEEHDHFLGMCKVSQAVEDGRVRFLDERCDLSGAETNPLIYNLPIFSEPPEIETRVNDSHAFCCTSLLDSLFANVDELLGSNPRKVVNVLDVFGDRKHLMKLLVHLTANHNASVNVWVCPSPIKQVLSIKEHRIVYLPIPKCGSSSIKFLLRSTFEKSFNQDLSPHGVQSSDSILFGADVTNDSFKGYQFFTVTRNPYLRLASLYNSRSLDGYVFPALRELYGDDSFATFVRFVASCPDALADVHFQSQAYRLYFGLDENFEILTIPLESPELLHDFLSRFSSKEILPHSNKSSRKGQDYITQYYTPDLLRQVTRRYGKDFMIGKYQTL